MTVVDGHVILNQNGQAASLANFIWAWTSMGVAVIMLVVYNGLIYKYRKHPLMAPREPYLPMTEITIILLSLIINMSPFSNLINVWSRFPCWLNNGITTAFCILPFVVSFARLTLFYRLVQLHMGVKPSNKISEGLIAFMGRACGPKQFLRVEALVVLSRKHMTEAVKGISSVPNESETSTIESEKYVTSIMRKKRIEEMLYWLCFKLMICWFWGIFAFVTVSTVTWDPTTKELVGTSFNVCSVSTLYPLGSLQAFMAALGIVCIATCLKMPSDNLGLKAELLFSQGIFCFFWIADGLVQAIVPDKFDVYGIYLDTAVILLHATLTFIFPAIIYFLQDRQFRKVRSGFDESVDFLRPADIEKLWATAIGRQKIEDVCRKGFAIENTVFLLSTEKNRKLNSKLFCIIFSQFIVQDAPFQINIPYKLIMEFKAVVDRIKKKNHVTANLDDVENHTNKTDSSNNSEALIKTIDEQLLRDLLQKVRNEVFITLAQNYGTVISNACYADPIDEEELNKPTFLEDNPDEATVNIVSDAALHQIIASKHKFEDFGDILSAGASNIPYEDQLKVSSKCNSRDPIKEYEESEEVDPNYLDEGPELSFVEPKLIENESAKD